MVGHIRGGLFLAALSMALLAPGPQPAQAQSARTPAPENTRLYFHYPLQGARVSSPFTVVIGLEGMGVAPAGVEFRDTGHHHILIDTQLDNFDEPLPNDAEHVHLGGGQTETTLDLPPGRHTLQLVLGDHAHVPHDPPVMSVPVTIYVR